MTTPDTADSRAAIEQELSEVYRVYAALAREMDAEFGLGGKLLFAGELDTEGCRLVRAANIAGAASLAASADSLVQRRAIREGVVDFLVTSLDEALRILKNEIRKRQSVAVCVALALHAVEDEMLARGVQPDLLSPSVAQSEAGNAFLAQGAELIGPFALRQDRRFLALEIPQHFVQRPAAFEGLLAQSVPADDKANRRWLHLSPRYLGPQARRFRSLECDAETAATLTEQFNKANAEGPAP